MTPQEAREIIIKERDSLKANPMVIVEDCLYEAFDLAIETLEVADKKPGKWELRSTEGPGRALMVYKCSECKKFALYMTDYCPNCGVKMEWRRQNEENKK